MNEIVKYDNYMNSLKFTGFTATDFNFFIALCSRVRDKGTTKISFTFDELKVITGYKQTSIKKFISDLERMNDKLMRVTCKLRMKHKTIMFVLFPTFITDDDEQLLTVSVNEEFKFILNELVKNFTRFDLKEFIELDSKYSKTLYRLLKQYRTTGRYEVSINDFRAKTDCPESYSNKYVMDLIIKPSFKELQNYFQNLKCEPQYAHKRGRPVTGYVFTFEPEGRANKQDLDQKHGSKSSSVKNQKTQNGFANFDQRTYDFEQLEGDLLSRRQKSENDTENIEEMIKELIK